MQQPTSTTVAVIGAGLSGLIAARDLHRRGVDVLVIEAAHRVGGRALSETTGLGTRVDLGGQWIGHNHRRIAALADEIGATRFRMRSGRLPAMYHRSRRLGPISVLAAAPALLVTEALSRIGHTERWNSITLASCLRRIPGETTRRLLELLATTSWTADLDLLSVHAAARMTRHQGGLLTMLGTRGGAQDTLVAEGMGTLVDAIADELGPRVWTGTRVTGITRTGDDVVVHTASGEVRAARAIVTVPPPMAAAIDFEPKLPAKREALIRTTYMGIVYKAIAVYERPFWRDRGAGDVLVLDPPARAVFDTSPPGGRGHLCFLVGGPKARELDDLDADTRRSILLEPLVQHAGSEVLAPSGWHEKSWHLDEFVGGAYLALPSPGTVEGLAPIDASPIDALHWAGTESAHEHPGYLDGAIESGERAAAEVLAALTARGTAGGKSEIEGP
ncbi:Amine oxidase OS=Tsukamurella paurometabola (strain ATCC 8368 / DSM / CCUG 35730 / CIP 100753/ JCM 10117 / KCTC 9821 / NBRC 16120 / NCIMB 702349 / NCTC 13040) OX=521096 GN=Tpau_1822 PE=3 SV=1 [Tsukamurella paurometabola]|uniref:Amine oxidase n=1 Tax=Tsukamurella paurometabola (strain ATCC 8368 / DSM 20162 / CCUG 35730 / CIP 100753 / JCM 10117 / KCTC 9821 / NBRC 16120 / NCIMB 702349 / NCTC 13040) TaxID=521096 RepID=D5UMU3_TSUPD|nr:FAD-dependent oxidoreductase [Tsukamurella paurometabola]ADG78440.1 amine oxidase [Tsukamurella paurometabola DSM 20162]SUP31641.1 Putrescine oxidase [Tsukamurella paurometabola]